MTRLKIFYTLVLMGFYCSAMADTLSWKGDVDGFTFEEGIIHSNLPTENTEAYIFTPIAITDTCTFSFRIQMDFNPSSSNLAKIYLLQRDPYPATGNGYFILVGGTGDEISLYKTTEGTEILLLKSTTKILDVSKVNVWVQLKRTSNGTWELFYQTESDSETVRVGEVADDTFDPFFTFGLYCKYTKTRATLFHFSEIHLSGKIYVDETPPTLINFSLLTSHSIQLLFDEAIVMDGAHFQLNQSVLPTAVSAQNSSTLHLDFPSEFIVGDANALSIQGIADTSGNILNDTTLYFQYAPLQLTDAFFITRSKLLLRLNQNIDAESLVEACSADDYSAKDYTYNEEDSCWIIDFNKNFKADSDIKIVIDQLQKANSLLQLDTTFTLTYHLPLASEIVFTEIMADPSPSVHLPEVEFLEFYNRSSEPISLYNLTVYINEKGKQLEAYRQIYPGEYISLVSSTDIDEVPESWNPIAIKSLPALSNSGFEVWLTNTQNIILDYFEYSPDFFTIPIKADGGWSLERIDTENCSNLENWAESENNDGGTPGYENSIWSNNPDLSPPTTTSVYTTSETSLMIRFSERMHPDDLSNIDNFSCAELQPQQSNGVSPAFTSVTIHFSNKMDSNEMYQLEISGLHDLNGNLMEVTQLSIGIPHKANYQQIALNEIMFDPEDGNPEFIELYNRSPYFMDMSTILLAKRDEDGLLKPGTEICSQAKMFPPQSYLVLSSDASTLIDVYSLSAQLVWQVDGMPTLNNDGDQLVLLHPDLEMIDEVDYSDDWHYPFLKNTKGVSLERIDTEAPGNTADNWTSASSSSGYQTAGKENSQHTNASDNKSIFTLETEIITPDNDGTDDRLVVTIPEDFSGYSLSMSIFNEHGRRVAQPYTNVYLGTNERIVWDGFSDKNQRLPSGVYIALIEVIHPEGNKKSEKLPFVISFTNK